MAFNLINSFAVNNPSSCGNTIILTNLSAHYNFDSQANDDSGNGLNGTEQASPTYAAGKFGSAISLNGTSQYVSVADNTLLEGSGGTITVLGWCKLTDFASDANPHIAAKWGTTTGWRMVARAGDILLTLGATNVAKGSGVATGAWAHIGFTYDNNNVKVYQNGVQVGTTSTVGALTLANAESMTMGRRSNAADGYLKGLIDDVSIWQRELTATEISTLYASSCPLKQ